MQTISTFEGEKTSTMKPLLKQAFVCILLLVYVGECEIDKFLLESRAKQALNLAADEIVNLDIIMGRIEVMIIKLPRIDPQTVEGEIQIQSLKAMIKEIEILVHRMHNSHQYEEFVDKAKLEEQAQQAVREVATVIDGLDTLIGLVEVMVKELPKIDVTHEAGRVELRNIASTVQQLEKYLEQLSEDMTTTTPINPTGTTQNTTSTTSIHQSTTNSQTTVTNSSTEAAQNSTPSTLKTKILSEYNQLLNTIETKQTQQALSGELALLHLETTHFESQVKLVGDDALDLLNDYGDLVSFFNKRLSKANLVLDFVLSQDELLMKIQESLSQVIELLNMHQNEKKLASKLALIRDELYEMYRQVTEWTEFPRIQPLLFTNNGLPELLDQIMQNIKLI